MFNLPTSESPQVHHTLAGSRLRGEQMRNPTHGSRTMTLTEPATQPDPPAGGDAAAAAASSSGAAEDQPHRFPGVLHLRAETTPGRSRPRVRWDDGVVDNESLNRKKSKVCCIFKKARRFDESDSDESDDSHGSGSEGNEACGHHHNHHRHNGEGSAAGKQPSLPPPNEYERMPRYTKKAAGHLSS